MQNAQTGQPNPLAILLMGKHSKPSSRALTLGALFGGLFAILGTTVVKVPAPAIVAVAVLLMALCIRLTPTPTPRRQQ